MEQEEGHAGAEEGDVGFGEEGQVRVLEPFFPEGDDLGGEGKEGCVVGWDIEGVGKENLMSEGARYM